MKKLFKLLGFVLGCVLIAFFAEPFFSKSLLCETGQYTLVDFLLLIPAFIGAAVIFFIVGPSVGNLSEGKQRLIAFIIGVFGIAVVSYAVFHQGGYMCFISNTPTQWEKIIGGGVVLTLNFFASVVFLLGALSNEK